MTTAEADAEGQILDLDVRSIGAALGIVAGAGIAVQCFFLLTVPPASGFETSVYEAYPAAQWMAFDATLVAAILLCLLAGVAETAHWRHGLGFLASNYALFFAIPVFRGYQLYGRGTADRLAHLGDIRALLQTGGIGTDFYPLEHVLQAELILTTTLNRELISYLFPFAMTLLYILSVALLVRGLTGRRGAFAGGLAAASPLLFTYFHQTVHPSFMSFMLVPTFLYLLLGSFDRGRRTSVRSTLPSAILAAAIVTFHPMTTLLVIVLFLSTVAFTYAFPLVSGRPLSKLSPLLAASIAIAWFTWNINFPGPRGLLRKILLVWIEGGRSVGQSEINRAASVPLSTRELIVQFIDLYGAIFIYLIAASLICLGVLYRLRHDTDDFAGPYLASQFATGILVSLLFFGVYLIASNPIRISRYMITMAMLLVGVSLVRHLRWRPSTFRRVVTVVMVLGIVSAAVLAGAATYRANNHMTEKEYQGSKFMLLHHDPSYAIRTYDMSDKMQFYTLGSASREVPGIVFQSGVPGYEIYPHLGYEENETAARSYGASYLVTKEYDLEFYRASTFTDEQREQVILYEPSDVARLSRDATAHKFYVNGGFTGWKVENETNASSA